MLIHHQRQLCKHRIYWVCHLTHNLNAVILKRVHIRLVGWKLKQLTQGAVWQIFQKSFKRPFPDPVILLQEIGTVTTQHRFSSGMFTLSWFARWKFGNHLHSQQYELVTQVRESPYKYQGAIKLWQMDTGCSKKSFLINSKSILKPGFIDRHTCESPAMTTEFFSWRYIFIFFFLGAEEIKVCK